MLNAFRKRLRGTPEEQIAELQKRLALYLDDLEYALNNISARDAWQVSEEDNVDASNGLLIDVYIPPNGVTRHIAQVLLRVKLKAFRSYSAVTASGGGSVVSSASGGGTSTTTGAGGGTTVSSASGGGTTVTSSSGGGSTPTSTTNSTSMSIAPTFIQALGTDTEASHDHAGAVAADGAHSHALYDHYHPHSHTVTISSHTHDVTIGNHTHDVTLSNHDHSVTIPNHTHDVTIPSHNHGITAAITTGATAAGCTILINGTDRTNALVGAVDFDADQDELDVTQYMTATGYNTIEITSAGLGRIRATVFVNLYLNDR